MNKMPTVKKVKLDERKYSIKLDRLQLIRQFF